MQKKLRKMAHFYDSTIKEGHVNEHYIGCVQLLNNATACALIKYIKNSTVGEPDDLKRIRKRI